MPTEHRTCERNVAFQCRGLGTDQWEKAKYLRKYFLFPFEFSEETGFCMFLLNKDTTLHFVLSSVRSTYISLLLWSVWIR